MHFPKLPFIRYMSSTSVRQKQPLITILGATGTGKSELAVHLALKLNGEVINGDALQLYQGLPIVTNKIAQAEQHGIRHHLLDIVALEEPTWIVSRFVREASRIVDDVRNRGKIPILVGGTHYYLQSMLFADVLVQKHNLADETELPTLQDDMKGNDTVHFITDEELNTKWPILRAGPEAIRAELMRVDPVMASKWHPNDHRKIRRSLVIFLQTGRLASEIYAGQARKRQTKSSSNAVKDSDDETLNPQHVDSLQYNNLLFWTYTQMDELDIRLEKRVDKMIKRGLIDEIKLLDDFRRQRERDKSPVQLDRGIWNAIGYKEFAGYLSAVNDPHTRQSEEQIKAALAHSKELTFIATRQYARSQIKWIKHKILPTLRSTGIPDKLYLLDSTKIDSFTTEVCDRAAEIANQWLSNKPIPHPKTISETSLTVLTGLENPRQTAERSPHVCEDCGVTVMTDEDWQNHIRNVKHRRRQKRKLQDARNPQNLARRERSKQNESVPDNDEETNDSSIGLAELDISSPDEHVAQS